MNRWGWMRHRVENTFGYASFVTRSDDGHDSWLRAPEGRLGVMRLDVLNRWGWMRHRVENAFGYASFVTRSDDGHDRTAAIGRVLCWLRARNPKNKTAVKDTTTIRIRHLDGVLKSRQSGAILSLSQRGLKD